MRANFYILCRTLSDAGGRSVSGTAQTPSSPWPGALGKKGRDHDVHILLQGR